MAVWKGRWSIGWLSSCTERVCIINFRLVCVFASSSCIGTEPVAYVPENVESENTDFRAVSMRSGLLSPLSPWACRRRKPRATGASRSSGTASGAQHIAHKKLAVGVHTFQIVPNFFLGDCCGCKSCTISSLQLCTRSENAFFPFRARFGSAGSSVAEAEARAHLRSSRYDV